MYRKEDGDCSRETHKPPRTLQSSLKTNQNKKIGYSDRRYAVLSHSIQPRNALDKRLKQGNCTLCASMVPLTSTEKTTDSLCHRPATQRIYS